MDGIGMASYLIPGLGEGLDIIWAFISAFVFYNWFHSSIGSVGALAEEVMPFTDFIPSFTIGHFICDDSNK